MNEEKVNLEMALRDALRREEPPFGFEQRVLRRARERRRQKMVRMWVAIAAMLAIVAVLSVNVRNYQEQQRRVVAQKAGRDLMVALKITGRKLNTTHKLIQRRMNGA